MEDVYSRDAAAALKLHLVRHFRRLNYSPRNGVFIAIIACNTLDVAPSNNSDRLCKCVYCIHIADLELSLLSGIVTDGRSAGCCC